ncbi:MAG: endonuclease MutS2 [Firmicutes bacterium]|nr:endonuclease MutS2 [Bacillota bacterium]
MDDRSLKKIEYDKIIEMLAEHCSFPVSREEAEALRPVDSSHYATQLLTETDEARELLRLYPTFSLGGLWDVRAPLHHASIGGVLEPEALVNIASLCRSARTTKAFFSELKGNFPVMTGLARSLVIIKTVESGVERAIGPDLSINDQASERLAGLRRKYRDKTERIKDRLDSLIKNPTTAKFLQDPIVTIREGRFVVPVKQEYRGQVAGVTHDMSSSGATVFIEPLAVMELNNELAAIKRDEEEEIAAILRGLSMVVNSFHQEINADLMILSRLDLLLAKGQLSWEMDGCSPKINEQGVWKLQKARHPLIPAAKVVPVDTRLDKDVSAMVITGPNTGGKTVLLKTIGLLTAMALSGLHIPADLGSEIACVDAVWADIGDEQSIEQSLSTFSAHMSNIVSILEAADERCLVLLDELGAGTDPTEGAALAMSILKHLKDKGAKTVATTHYSELKAFAYNTPGFINACMEFNVQTLSPTYRLMMGLPGKSNAFEISSRLGLPQQIIDDAAESLTTEDVAVSAMLSNLEELRRQLADEQDKIQVLRASAAAREKHLAQREQKLQAEQAQILRKAHEEAQKIIDETMAKSRALYDEQQKAIAEQKSAERIWQESRKKLKSWREQLEEETPQPVYAGQAPSKLSVGDYVFLPKLNQSGTVLSLPDSGGEVDLQVGVLKLRAKVSELRLSNGEPPKKNKVRRGGGTSAGAITMRKSSTVEPYLDLHGLETMEAMPILEKYIDDAFLAGLRQVEINHGRGTGALRNFVHSCLKGNRLVKTYRDGTFHEGGLGVTIVELNQ